MITDKKLIVKRVWSWLMIGAVLWNSVGVPWVLASEETPVTPPEITSPVSAPEPTSACTTQSEPTEVAEAIVGEHVSTEETPDSSDEELVAKTGAAISESVAVTEVNTSILGDSSATVAIATPEASSSSIVLGGYLPENDRSATVSAIDREMAGAAEIEIDNSASVSAEVVAEARSGEIMLPENEKEGMSSVTGDATALAVNIALVNTTLINSDLWIGVVAMTQGWDGNIYIPVNESRDLGLNSVVKLSIDNKGDVVSDTVAEATTGEVAMGGDGVVETGDATSTASNIVLAATTLINSEVTAIFVDNLWLWQGQIYNLRGQGSVDSPQQVWMSQNRDIPEDCNKIMSCVGEVKVQNEAIVEINTVANATTGEVRQGAAGQGGIVQTGDAVAVANTTALVNTTLINSRFRLLNLLLGAPWRGDLIFVYPEEGNDQEPSIISSPTPLTEPPQPEKSQGEQPANNESPHLRISATHNALNGIYAGDGVTYDVTVYNDGPITAHNVILIQDFYTAKGVLVGSMKAKVGEIGLNKRRLVHFVLNTGLGAEAGVYMTKTWAEGESDRLVKASSNEVIQQFEIRGRGVVLAASTEVPTPVEVVDIGDEVLGIAVEPVCTSCFAEAWYIAIWLGSLLYFGVCIKRDDWWKVMRVGSTLPVTAYVGLWYSNLDCRNGIGMLPNNPWCDWFLILAIAIYVINGVLVKSGKILVTRMSRQ